MTINELQSEILKRGIQKLPRGEQLFGVVGILREFGKLKFSKRRYHSITTLDIPIGFVEKFVIEMNGKYDDLIEWTD